MSSRVVPRLLLLGAVVAGLAVSPAGADRIDLVARLDLSEILGPVGAAYRIPAIAHDGTHLWLIHPDGDRLLRVDPQQGSLVDSVPLAGHAVVEPDGLAFGEGSLWVLDNAQRRVLRIAPDGRIRSVLDLRNVTGELLGVDFLTRDGQSQIQVAVRGLSGLPDQLLGWIVKGDRIVVSQAESMVVQDATAMASTLIDQVRYRWVSTPRSDFVRLEGDVPADGTPLPAAMIEVRAPDDLIPRGGEDWASTHRLALVDPDTGSILWEVYPPGLAPDDIATSGATIFYPAGSSVLVGLLMQDYAVNYGACAVRDVKYVQTDWYHAPLTVNMSFAVPYDPDMGPPDPIFYEDGTGGYLAQTLMGWLEMDPSWGIRHSEYTLVGGEANIRQGLHFPFDYTDRPRTEFKIRVRVCEASRNVDPARVGPFEWIPERERTLFYYDGDGDGFGDDDPTTCADDYYRLDSATVHQHTVASGALAEANLYHRVRRIHEYLLRRHVYSGSDGGWADPVKKLESAYASCSPTAFMVVAMAREAGIPARLVGTTKQRGNLLPGAWARDEAFHRWAQVYLPPYGWVRVDSTPESPGTVGFSDVNADGRYNNCDLCITDAQCQADFGVSFSDCNIVDTPPSPFTNPNDRDGDGDVDSDDVELIGAWYWTPARLAGRRIANGVGMRDLITVTAVGVPDNVLEAQYIGQETDYVGLDCNPHLCYGEQWRLFTDWSNPILIFGVLVSFASATDDATATVSWSTDGPFGKLDRVRIDLYELISQGQQLPPRYRFIRNLALDVDAFQGEQAVDLGNLPDEGDLVVVVTRQGGSGNAWFSGLARADWETFGVSQVLPN